MNGHGAGGPLITKTELHNVKAIFLRLVVAGVAAYVIYRIFWGKALAALGDGDG